MKNKKNKKVKKAKKEVEEEEEHFVVEEILDKKIVKNIPWYLIKWEGYSNTDNTWEPIYNINADNLISQFESKNNTQNISIQEKVNKLSESILEFYNLDLNSNIVKILDIKQSNDVITSAVVQYTDKSVHEISYEIIKKEMPDKLFTYYEDLYKKFL